MFCRKCGFQYDDSARFCPKCGEAKWVPQQAPSQNAPAATPVVPQQSASSVMNQMPPQAPQSWQQASQQQMPQVAQQMAPMMPQQAPQAPAKKSHLGLILGITVPLALIIIGLLVVILINIMGNKGSQDNVKGEYSGQFGSFNEGSTQSAPAQESSANMQEAAPPKIEAEDMPAEGPMDIPTSAIEAYDGYRIVNPDYLNGDESELYYMAYENSYMYGVYVFLGDYGVLDWDSYLPLWDMLINAYGSEEAVLEAKGVRSRDDFYDSILREHNDEIEENVDYSSFSVDMNINWITRAVDRDEYLFDYYAISGYDMPMDGIMMKLDRYGVPSDAKLVVVDVELGVPDMYGDGFAYSHEYVIDMILVNGQLKFLSDHLVR